jgi:hypothetical protein
MCDVFLFGSAAGWIGPEFLVDTFLEGRTGQVPAQRRRARQGGEAVSGHRLMPGSRGIDMAGPALLRQPVASDDVSKVLAPLTM